MQLWLQASLAQLEAVNFQGRLAWNEEPGGGGPIAAQAILHHATAIADQICSHLSKTQGPKHADVVQAAQRIAEIGNDCPDRTPAPAGPRCYERPGGP